MRKSIISSLFILALSSCSQQNSAVSKYVGLFEIENEVLKKTINDYVKGSRIDLKRTVITVLMSQGDSTETYLVSNGIDDPFSYNNKPFAYAKLGNAWVVFFNMRSNPFIVTDIKKGFFDSIEKEGVKLEKGYVFYNPKYVLLKISANKKVKITEL